jgi:hemoglobin-like flavoprotein
MTPRQVQLVQESFVNVLPIASAAADMFYGRLFEVDPSLRRLFKGDMQEQGRMLMAMIGVAVRGLSNPAPLLPVLKDLGARHLGYGVEEHHYDTVGNALIWTLQRGLGEAFTDELCDAWVAAYQLLSSVMQEGARNAQLAKAA